MHKIILTCFTLAVTPVVAFAQEQDGDLSHGAELLGEGAQMLLRGLLEEFQPTAEGWAKLVDLLQDFHAYHLPEMLPNGDIIIRRIEPLEPGIGENGEVDL